MKFAKRVSKKDMSNNLNALVAPSAVDDVKAGYGIGSVWIDTVKRAIYTCIDAGIGAAVWVEQNSPQLIKIGDINFEDVNASVTTAKIIDIVFADKKPAGVVLKDLFFKNTEAVTNYTANTIVSVALKAPTQDVSTLNATSPNKALEDITVTLTINNDNLQDWLTGNIEVYGIFEVYYF